MDCHDIERLIEAYLDRELSGDKAKQVESHLAGCPDCRARYGAILTLLHSPRPVSVPPRLGDRIVAAIHEQSGPARAPANGGRTSAWTRFTSVPWTPAVAAGLVLVVLGWFVFQFSGRPPQDGTGPVAGRVTAKPDAPPNPWVLSSWAQAITLPGPGSPTAALVQAVAMDLLNQPSPDPTPVIRVRRCCRHDDTPDDAETPLPRIPFILGLSNVGA